jgi:predicted phage tail protein
MLQEAGIPVKARSSINLLIFVGDKLVSADKWDFVVPRDGAVVTVRGVPAGGGEGGKNPFRVLLTIAVMALSYWTGGAAAPLLGLTGAAATIATAAVTVGISMAGMMAVNALCPPQEANLKGDAGSALNNTASPSISGGNNAIDKYGPIARPLGRHRVIPKMGATPYTEVIDGQQWIRLYYVIGYGPLQIEDILIGDVDINSIKGLQYEVRYGYEDDPPLTLYPTAVVDKQLSLKLTNSATFFYQTTGRNCDEIIVDLTFPSGLYFIGDDGTFSKLWVDFEIQYAPVNTENWSISTEWKAIDAATVEVFSWSHGIMYPNGYLGRVVQNKYAGSYEVLFGNATVPPPVPGYAAPICRFRAQGSPAQVQQIWDERTPTAPWRQNLSDFTPSIPVVGEENIAVSAGTLAAPFTVGAKQGTPVRRSYRFPVDGGQYTVRVRRITPDTDTAQYIDDCYWTSLKTVTGGEPSSFNKPLAKLALFVPATAVSGSVDQVSLTATSILRDWDSVSESWHLRATNNPASCLREVWQGNAAAIPMPDAVVHLEDFQNWHERCTALGLEYNNPLDYRVGQTDLSKEIAACGRAALTFYNGKYSVIQDRPDLVVKGAFGPRNSWGFSAERVFNELPHAFRCLFANREKNYEDDEVIVYRPPYDENTATLFEQLPLAGINTAALAWSHGVYHMATLIYRPEVYTWYADFGYMAARRGDLIECGHDVTLWGVSQGRVTSIDAVNVGGVDYVTGCVLDCWCPMAADKDYAVRFWRADGTAVLIDLVTHEGESNELEFLGPELLADSPAVGDMGYFGELGNETAQLIIHSVEPQDNLTAMVKAVDAAPEIHTAEIIMPPYESGITPPYEVLKTYAPPIVDTILSDETVLLRAVGGGWLPRFVVTFAYKAGLGFDQIVGMDVSYRPSDADDAAPWLGFRVDEGFTAQVSITDVEVGVAYDLRFRYRFATGKTSIWTERYNQVVIGTATLPPDVTGLALNAGILSWVYPVKPVDFNGFVVRYCNGDVDNWEIAQPAHDGLLAMSSLPIADLADGQKTFLVKAVDTAGNESANAASLYKDFGLVDIGTEVYQKVYARKVARPRGYICSPFTVKDMHGTYDMTMAYATVQAYQYRTGGQDNLPGVNDWYMPFSGTSQHLYNDAIGTAIGNGVTSLAVGLKFKADVTSGNDGLFYMGDFASTYGEIMFGLQSNLLRFWLKNNTVNQSIAFTDTASWHRLLFSYDGAKVKAFLDGVKVIDAAYVTSFNLAGLKTVLGAYYQSDLCFDGELDDCRIWTRGLTDTEAYQWSAGSDVAMDDLFAWYRFNDTRQVTDKGGYGAAPYNHVYVYGTAAPAWVVNHGLQKVGFPCSVANQAYLRKYYMRGPGTSDMSFWIKFRRSSVTAANEQLIHHRDSTGGASGTDYNVYFLQLDTVHALRFSFGLAYVSGVNPTVTANSNTLAGVVIDDTEPHTAAVTVDRDGEMTLWVDGVNLGSVDVSSHAG